MGNSKGMEPDGVLVDALGDEIVGADISFLLELDGPNEPVEVTLPAG